MLFRSQHRRDPRRLPHTHRPRRHRTNLRLDPSSQNSLPKRGNAEALHRSRGPHAGQRRRRHRHARVPGASMSSAASKPRRAAKTRPRCARLLPRRERQCMMQSSAPRCTKLWMILALAFLTSRLGHILPNGVPRRCRKSRDSSLPHLRSEMWGTRHASGVK